MSERRSGRGLPPRTDSQILANDDDVELLAAIGRGQVVVEPANRMTLRRLAREECCLAGFGVGVAVTLLPRGHQIVWLLQRTAPEFEHSVGAGFRYELARTDEPHRCPSCGVRARWGQKMRG